MALQRNLLLLLLVLLAINTQVSRAQHWSHGWYPGGKRELGQAQTPEVSEVFQLCEGDDCAFVRSPRTNLFRSILADLVAGRFQKKK
ncbi:progonadoliberin-2 [Callorhinchus milii]|uniref:Progonadoliberin n=1 Tax=Callorhinchus milii TaxID=7868 RepID=B2BF85_CALMI|nr:progonadoliberin-2 [Callorhinchus milii]ABU55293.1 chicken-II-type gonadotropin-releasing hormone [Callorhinchus milii]ACN32398.1 gonadotrophin-releasing hormone 2 precursor [Callorhinchus milii]|eukprot:gi/632960463/ref/XP_007896209.1/ PREDICTED: progonadoliberin-2 [Callorhinchus milii]